MKVKSRAKPKSKPKAKKSKLQKASSGTTSGWPIERDYMERPERFKYVRKMLPEVGCVFCNAVKVGVDFSSLMLYQNDLAMVVQNKFPYNTGHLLVLPKRHVGDLTETSAEELKVLGQLVKDSVGIVREVYGCEGINIGLNLGSAAGAGIPGHLHWHIVPRWNGDTNFFPLLAGTKVLPETLQQTFEKLLPYFKVLK